MLRIKAADNRSRLVFFFVYIISVICGSVYCCTLGSVGFTSVSDYLSNYVNQEINKNAVLNSALINNIIMFLIVNISALFKHGVILSGGAIFIQGFSSAFCTASLCRNFGVSGMVLGCALEFHFIILIPLLVEFSAFSLKIKKNRLIEQKNFKIFLIFFEIIMFATFCGCAFFQTYVNTTFMKFVILKLIK